MGGMLRIGWTVLRAHGRALSLLSVLSPLSARSARLPSVVPPGTHLPIRFLYPLASGRDTVGTRVLVQTMGALVQDSCVVGPAFTQVQGRVTLSPRHTNPEPARPWSGPGRAFPDRKSVV